MTEGGTETNRLEALRKRAETTQVRDTMDTRDLSLEEVRDLVYELRTHQIELEMQNEEFRRNQEELAESRDRYSDLYEFAPIGYLTVSHKGLIIEANLTLATMLGVERRALVNHIFSAFIIPNDQGVYYRHRREVLSSKQRETCLIRMLRRNAETFWAEMASILIEADDESDTRLRMVISDISGRKQAEQQIKQLNRDLQHRADDLEAANLELEAKNAELERFTYTVSHDLKAPLVTIKGFLGLLEQDTANNNIDQMKGDMRRIADAADKMARLLDELLELSRIGRLMNPPQEVSFTELAHEATALVAGQIGARGAVVTIEPASAVIYGDQVRLLEVLQNLIENAVKFMGEQTAPRIKVGVQQDDGEVVCFVRDNGIGIDPKYHEKVFGLFERLKATDEGTGIGLALVRRIVEVHGGRIWVESAGVGQGSTFYFTLPSNSS